jgi:PAS domain S-box-containing protein
MTGLETRPEAEAISTSDRELAVAIDLLPVAALIYDRDDGSFGHANPLFESTFGIANEEFVKHRIHEFYSDPDEHDGFILQLALKGVISGRQVTACSGDGTELWLDTSSRWVVYRGRPAVLTLFTNIDTEKRAQLASEIEQKQASELSEISAIIASSRPGVDVFGRVADVVSRLIPFDRMGIAQMDPDYGTFTLKFIRGLQIEGRGEGDKLLIGQSLNAYVAESRESLVIDDIDASEIPIDYPGLRANRDAGIRSLVTTPMIADDRVVGTISLRSTELNMYAPERVALLERLASLLAPALEQSRLYQNLEREAHERQIIAEIGQVISSSPDVDEVYDRFTDLVRQILTADRLVVTAFEEASQQFVIMYRSGIDVPSRSKGQRITSAGSLMPIVTETRKPVLFRPIDNAEVEREYSTLVPVYQSGLRSFLSIPLFVGDRIVGSIQFFSNTENDYQRRHIQLAESIASQIAGAIASSLLREVEQQTASENVALAEIGRIITSTTDVRTVFERFGQLVGEILPLERLVVILIDADAGTATDTYIYGRPIADWTEGTVHATAGTAFEKMLRTRQIQYTPRISEGLNHLPAYRDRLTHAGFESSLLAPLISNGKLIGCPSFSDSNQDAYTPRYIGLAERVADQIAGAIANARLYADLQQVADERRALTAITLAATQNLDLDGVFARAADSLIQIVNYDRMSITLLDQEDDSLRVAFTRGQRLSKFRTGDVVEPVKGDPFDGESWTWQSGLSLAARKDGRLRAIVQAPLGSRPHLLGYIRLQSHTADAYDESSKDLLERVATSLTPAVQNALQHSREKGLALERERSLILDHENQELQRLSDAKSQFLTTVTHELKTPLTSITAFTNILLKNRSGRMTEKELSHLVVIQRNNRRLKNLIDDLLDLSQIDQDGLSLTLTDFNVDELLSEVVDGFKPISDAKSQELISSSPAQPVVIRADRDRLSQVMINLLSNASKYSPNGENIHLTARRWKDRIYFSVTDQGMGISNEDKEGLFTLFFRADNEETRSVPGTGIGLYIVKTIVDLHGGKIEAKSPPGGGTSIIFYIPGAYSGVIDTQQQERMMARVIPWSRMDDLPQLLPVHEEEKEAS